MNSLNKYFFFSLQWGHVLVNVNHLLTVINSAFNFLIYWSFCCGKRRRRRSRRQREMLSQKTFTTHRDHSYITYALVGWREGQKMPIFAYFQ